MTIAFFPLSGILFVAAVLAGGVAGLFHRERPLVVSGAETWVCDGSAPPPERRPGLIVVVDEEHGQVGLGIASRNDNFWPNCDTHLYPIYDAFEHGGTWMGRPS